MLYESKGILTPGLRSSTLLCAGSVLFLACTPGDIPTEPGSIAAEAKSSGVTLIQKDLGIPDVYSAAYALNNQGQVVGERASAFEAPGRAFLWDRGSVTDLGTLGGLYARAFGINELGQVVGDATNADGQTHAFLWEHGIMQDLGTLGSDWSTAIDVNNAGQVVGNSMTALNEVHGFVSQNGAMTDLGTLGGVATYPAAINNNGEVVGSSLTTFELFPGQPVDHAFIWRQGTMTDLGTLGGFFSRAQDINDKGQVVGVADTRRKNGESHGFLWEDGKMKDLGANFRPLSINNRGQIVGSNPALEVLLWDRGKLIKVVDEGFPNRINDSTTIAGQSGGAVRHAVIWTR